MYVVLFALHSFGAIHALHSDIDCLKSIKASLEDPLGHLSGWNFNNKTEGFICSFIGIDCWNNKVLNIRLSNKGLKGPFPRGIQTCSSLEGLDLSENYLYGSLPSNISILRYVTSLDLSSNRFSGEIPVDLANCVYLNVLKLDNNQLTGQIPTELGQLARIKVFSVANNRLTGPVPHFPNTDANYANNLGLCGAPSLPDCNEPSEIRAFFISGFFTGFALFTAFILFLRHFGLPGKKLLIKFTNKIDRQNNRASASTDDDENFLELDKFVSRMSFIEITNATANFSADNLIGYGTLGKVYKAVLPNGYPLAIKRLHMTENLDEEFCSEILTLGILRNQMIVPLIGFCCQGKEKLLVYKYIPNGSLHDWLHTTEDKAEALDWSLRMKIAVGVAKALSWLHYSCGLNVVHNGLSSKSILLDQNFEPRISKFWEKTIMNPNNPASCWGVLANNAECADSFSPYTKDVYCFGIVLLELITRKEAYELGCSTEIIFGSSTTTQLQIDGVIANSGSDYIISQFLEIAKNCVKFLPNQRPTMLQVHESLSSIAQSRMVNTCSEISLDYT